MDCIVNAAWPQVHHPSTWHVGGCQNKCLTLNWMCVRAVFFSFKSFADTSTSYITTFLRSIDYQMRKIEKSLKFSTHREEKSCTGREKKHAQEWIGDSGRNPPGAQTQQCGKKIRVQQTVFRVVPVSRPGNPKQHCQNGTLHCKLLQRFLSGPSIYRSGFLAANFPVWRPTSTKEGF